MTVSLDSLDDATFRAMNDVDFPVADVLEGIEAALAAGLGPVKVNMVVKRGVNEHGILAMAERFRGTGVILRFIEYMDVGATNGWQLDEVVPVGRDRARDRRALAARAGRCRPTAARSRRATAIATAAGEIGLISSVTQPFCHDCTRARLSAEGKLYTCLFASRGHDLRALVRGELSDAELDEQLRGLWRVRDDRYSELRTQGTPLDLPKVEMSHIGG